MAGRRPKPTALKILAGNPGHRPLNDMEPGVLEGNLEKPKGLGTIASREWDFMVAALGALNMLSTVDRRSLAEYCVAVEVSELAYRDMRHTGLFIDEPWIDTKTGGAFMHPQTGLMMLKHKANPAVGVWKTASGVMKAYLIEFGLTPASRAKLKIQPKPEKDEGEEFMKGRTAVEVAVNPAVAFNTGKVAPGAQPAGQSPDDFTDFDA